MSCGNLVHLNPSTTQLTETKHSTRKNRSTWKKSSVENWSAICKKKYSEEKGAQPSINENKDHYDYEQLRSWVEEGLRECHMKNQSEEMGALWSARKQLPRRTAQKRPKEQPEKAKLQWERCPWKRTTQPWKRTWLKKKKPKRSHKRKNM